MCSGAACSQGRGPHPCLQALSSEWDSTWQHLIHCFISTLGPHFLVANGPLQTPKSWWAVAAVPADLLQVLVSRLAVAASLRHRGDSISKLIWDDLFLWETACSARARATALCLPQRCLVSLCICGQRHCFKVLIGVLHPVWGSSSCSCCYHHLLFFFFLLS